MNDILVVTPNPSIINFAPATIVEEILQNVYTIVSTTYFSVPLFREFGVTATFLDTTDMLARSKLVGEIIEKVELFENRVIVEEVAFKSDGDDGILMPVLCAAIARQDKGRSAILRRRSQTG